MAQILKGKPVADALTAQMKKDVEELKAAGVTPTLCIFRVGERPDDLSYERGATKRASVVGIEVRNVILPADVSQEVFDTEFRKVNEDDSIHGILLFRPLPGHLDNEKARQMLNPAKDIDGCTDLSLAGVFTNTKTGFPPCTAQAAMEILHHFGIQIKGKKAAVIGRSLVIGRPAAMLLMHANATVTICHTRTLDVPSVTREADLVIAASGQMESIGADYFRPLQPEAGTSGNGQVVIDVGIGWNDVKHKLCGDVCFEEAEPLVSAITPVPGGVGAVTTAVLALQTVEAALRPYV